MKDVNYPFAEVSLEEGPWVVVSMERIITCHCQKKSFFDYNCFKTHFVALPNTCKSIDSEKSFARTNHYQETTGGMSKDIVNNR